MLTRTIHPFPRCPKLARDSRLSKLAYYSAAGGEHEQHSRNLDIWFLWATDQKKSNALDDTFRLINSKAPLATQGLWKTLSRFSDADGLIECNKYGDNLPSVSAFSFLFPKSALVMIRFQNSAGGCGVVQAGFWRAILKLTVYNIVSQSRTGAAWCLLKIVNLHSF